MASTTSTGEAEKRASDNSPPPEMEKGSTSDPNAAITSTSVDDSTLAILELIKAQDAHHPMHWPAWKRWSIIIVYCILQVFVTMTSTSYRKSKLKPHSVRRDSQTGSKMCLLAVDARDRSTCIPRALENHALRCPACLF